MAGRAAFGATGDPVEQAQAPEDGEPCVTHIGTDGAGLGAVNISCPTSRWSMADMERELAPRLIETVGFISSVPAARADSGIHHSQRNQS